MGRNEWGWTVPDGFWEIARPSLPLARVRPQGGGTRNTPDEAVFAAIVYVLVSGCAWRALPPCFGISKSTAHRRLLIWSRAGVWAKLHQAVLDELAAADLLDLSRVVLDSAHVRAKRGGRTCRPEPRGPGQAGFQDACPVRPVRTACRGRCLIWQHPRQRSPPTRRDRASNETRPSPRPVDQARKASRRQGL